MDEPIEMSFGDSLVQTHETIYWRHLANTVDRSARGGDAALRQITVTTCEVVAMVARPSWLMRCERTGRDGADCSLPGRLRRSTHARQAPT